MKRFAAVALTVVGVLLAIALAGRLAFNAYVNAGYYDPIAVGPGEEVTLGKGLSVTCPQGWRGEWFPPDDAEFYHGTKWLSVQSLELEQDGESPGSWISVWVNEPREPPTSVPEIDADADRPMAAIAKIDLPRAREAWALTDRQETGELFVKARVLPDGARAFFSIIARFDAHTASSVFGDTDDPAALVEALFDYLDVEYEDVGLQ